MGKLKFDVVGYWSEVKLDIIREYAAAYSSIFNSGRQVRFSHVYIDAFAGAGIHVSKETNDTILGSPLIAVQTEPPFREHHFIDLDGTKVASLRSLIGKRQDVHFHEGDCNRIMLEDVLPNVRYEDYRRGLCLLDPYGLHLHWDVIRTAGRMGTIDMFLNFPIADMNRNVFWRNPEGVDAMDIARMNAFWGDDSWHRAAYEPVQTLFGNGEEKLSNDAVATAFQTRLREVAGFDHVPAPIPMRNSQGATVYYLYFASQNKTAERIAKHVFNKYRERGALGAAVTRTTTHQSAVCIAA